MSHIWCSRTSILNMVVSAVSLMLLESLVFPTCCEWFAVGGTHQILTHTLYDVYEIAGSQVQFFLDFR